MCWKVVRDGDGSVARQSGGSLNREWWRALAG